MTENGRQGTKNGGWRFELLVRHLSSAVSLPIHLYRHTFAFFLGGECRYAPSCSAYALEALKAHGPAKGALLALRRISRCHPWSGHGFDPVPRTDDR